MALETAPRMDEFEAEFSRDVSVETQPAAPAEAWRFQLPFGVAGDLFTLLPMEGASKGNGSIVGTKTLNPGDKPATAPMDRTDRVD